MNNTTIFVDMDGVIAKYDRHAYDRNNGPIPGVALFEHEESHYFLSCEPDPKGILLLETMIAAKNTDVFILTTVAEHIPWAADDKKKWLRTYCPKIDVERQLIITSSDKTEIAKAKMTSGQLSDKTILIDDFNKNLLAWHKAGGKAIKYLNGINSPDSWKGEIYDGRK